MIGALAALASSFTWAFGSGVYSRLSRGYSAPQVNFTRASLALPCFLAGSVLFSDVRWNEVFLRLGSGNAAWLLASMLASYGLGDVFFFWSTRALGLPGALAIASSYPLWSVLVGWLFEGQTLSPLKILGVGLTVAGTVTVVLAGYRFRAAQAREWLDRYEIGVLFGGLTSLFWALNTFAVSKGGEGLSPQVSSAVRMAFALVLCPVIGFVLSRSWKLGISWKSLRPVLPVFLLEAYGGSFFFMYGLTHAPLAIASALSSLAPVIAVPMAWQTRTEPVSWGKAVGVCLAVLGAVILVQ